MLILQAKSRFRRHPTCWQPYRVRERLAIHALVVILVLIVTVLPPLSPFPFSPFCSAPQLQPAQECFARSRLPLAQARPISRHQADDSIIDIIIIIGPIRSRRSCKPILCAHAQQTPAQPACHQGRRNSGSGGRRSASSSSPSSTSQASPPAEAAEPSRQAGGSSSSRRRRRRQNFHATIAICKSLSSRSSTSTGTGTAAIVLPASDAITQCPPLWREQQCGRSSSSPSPSPPPPSSSSPPDGSSRSSRRRQASTRAHPKVATIVKGFGARQQCSSCPTATCEQTRPDCGDARQSERKARSRSRRRRSSSSSSSRSTGRSRSRALSCAGRVWQSASATNAILLSERGTGDVSIDRSIDR